MIRLAVRVARAEAEVVLAALLDLAPSGVEREVELDGDVVEYAVYGASGELPELPDLRAAAGSALVEVRTTEVADDWDERWKAFHQPVLVGDPASGPAVPCGRRGRRAWAGPAGAVRLARHRLARSTSRDRPGARLSAPGRIQRPGCAWS